MTEVFLQPPKGYPVTVGGITLYLAAYKTVGACLIREQGTADGVTEIAALYPKGTRLTLEGTLPPQADAAAVTAALAKRMQDGTQEDVTVQGLVYAAARLCGYTVSEGQENAKVTLQFYTVQAPALAEGAAV